MERIEEIKNLMDEYRITYWKAAEIVDNFYFDEQYRMPYCFSQFKGNIISTYKGESLYYFKIKIIKKILEKEELVLWEDTISEVYRCPECGDETGGSNSSIEDFCSNPAEKLIPWLLEADCINITKRIMINGKEYYYVQTDTEKEIIDDFICETCEEIACTFYNEQGDYKEGNIDGLFDTLVWSHGLATGFSGSCDTEEIVNRIVNLDSHSEWQICCSHKAQRIGPIGVYMKGHAQFVSNIDLHSRIDSRGYRVFDPSDWRAEEGLIFSPEEISLDSWDHSETILVNHRIVGIWVKEWALKDPNLKKLWDYLVPIAKDNGWLTHVCKARRE